MPKKNRVLGITTAPKHSRQKSPKFSRDELFLRGRLGKKLLTEAAHSPDTTQESNNWGRGACGGKLVVACGGRKKSGQEKDCLIIMPRFRSPPPPPSFPLGRPKKKRVGRKSVSAQGTFAQVATAAHAPSPFSTQAPNQSQPRRRGRGGSPPGGGYSK